MNEAIGMQTVLARFLADTQQNHPLNPRQWQVCHHWGACQTEALGGCQLHCDQCAYGVPQYHSCRDRHCPRCQRQASAVWCEKQCQSVLPVTYYHVVFTLPHPLNPWVQRSKEPAQLAINY